MGEKKRIRKEVIQRRDGISLEEKSLMDQKIFEKLIECKEYKAAEMIFIFVSYVSEVDTKKIISHALESGKKVCVPKVKSMFEGLSIHRIDNLLDLEVGFRGILEPKAECELVESNDIDLIIMPGVAFGLDGARVGYGGGFYDRFISSLKKDIKKIAIAYEMQIVDNIPMHSHDARIDGIITDQRVEIFYE